MKLKDLSNMDSSTRKLLSWMILEDKKYLEDVGKGLPFFTKEEISEIEKSEKYKSELTFLEINKKLSAKGMILKLPTFKKYVTLKLIPDSIGTQKTDKGIVGLYPSQVIRAINFIKYSLYANLDFTPIIDRFINSIYDQFKTTLLELIESTFPDELWVYDFSTVQGNFNKIGEAPPDAIRRYVYELFEKKLIKDQKKKEIIELVETVEESIVTAHEGLHSLKEILGEISIPGKLGFEMLQSMEES